MPRETNIWEIIKAAGYEPIENRSIVVSYASSNLSDAIIKFFTEAKEFFCTADLQGGISTGAIWEDIVGTEKRSHNVNPIFRYSKDRGRTGRT